MKETKAENYPEKDIRRFFLKKEITAIFFVIFIMYLFISSFFENINLVTAVNTHGFIQKILNKKEENNFEVIKDNEGFLHLTSFLEKPNSVETIVESTERLKDSVNNYSTKFIYLMTPDKVIPGYNTFERGIPKEFNNETADNFLESLEKKSIEYIDFRDDILSSGIDKKDLFYKTDNHWRVETAFYAYTCLLDKLNVRYGEKLDDNSYFRDLNNYNCITFENAYLGSLGRKTGRYYGGVDNFTLIYPKFNTSFNLYYKTNDVEVNTSGRFEESLLIIDNLRNNNLFLAESDKYSTYLFGNQGFLHVENNLNKDGLKVLFIKDSFAVPVAAFLSSTVSEIYMIDPRYYDEDILETIKNYKNLDYIFLSFSPQNLTPEFFKF